MIRRVVATVVLLTWAASMGWLAVRTARAPAEAVAREEPLPVTPASAYYTLRLDTTLVGFASITLDTSVTTVSIQEVVDLRLPDGDTLLRVMLRGETSLTRGLRLRQFAYMRTVNGRRTAVRGVAVSDSLLEWQVGQERTASATDTVALPSTRLQTPTTLPLALVFAGRLRPGTVRNYPVADPLTRQVRMGAMLLLGDSTFVVPDSAGRDTVAQRFVPARWDTVHAWRVERRGLGAPSHLWVDDDGLPVAGEWVPGIRFERQPFEIATQEYRAAIAARFPGMPRPAGHAALQRPVRAVPRLAVHLAGIGGDSAGWARAGLASGAQALAHDTLVTGASTDSAPPPAPARDGLVPALDEAVARQAAAVVGDDRDPLRMVRRLAAWTARDVRPAPEDEFTDARLALRRREGDASARAALFAAMARASGVAARPVAGLVADGATWRRHAWAEAWVGGRWVPVDPTLGVAPASGAYVALLRDAPSDPVLVVPLAARLAPGAPLRLGRP